MCLMDKHLDITALVCYVIFTALLTPIVEFGIVGEDYVNITWSFTPDSDMPIGSSFEVKYKRAGT